MKTGRDYNYDNRTLAMWYHSRILEGQGSYYSLFQKLSEDVVARSTATTLMKYMDKVFCDEGIKISLLKKAILYILGTSPDRALSRKEIINTVTNRLEVSPQVLERSTKRGGKSTLEREIGWEIYHLLDEGKIVRISRGYYKAC